ncbi:MAG: hypothetical protein ACR2QS_16030 [Woeseiaceae bacterium]
MENGKPEMTSWEAATARNTVRLALWTIAWVLTLAMATFGPLLLWESGTLPSVIAIAVNLAAGVGMIIAYKNHLRGLDELQRKMQLEAMALSLGVGLIAGLGFSTMDIANLISFDAEISHMVMLMSITYAIGLAISRRKYA